MEGAKVCGRCGADVSGRSRSKRSDGTYVCRKCMHGDRRAEKRARALRRNLLWPLIILALSAIAFLTLWATSRPPRGSRR